MKALLGICTIHTLLVLCYWIAHWQLTTRDKEYHWALFLLAFIDKFGAFAIVMLTTVIVVGTPGALYSNSTGSTLSVTNRQPTSPKTV